MGADYGGTEIRKAIEHVVASHTTHMPTAIFLLTDGEVCTHSLRCATALINVHPRPMMLMRLVGLFGLLSRMPRRRIHYEFLPLESAAPYRPLFVRV